MPRTSSAALTSNANATWLKVCQFSVAARKPSKASQAPTAPIDAADERRGPATSIEHRDHDRRAAEADGFERGDLAGARGDGGVHRVQRAEDRAEAHQRA